MDYIYVVAYTPKDSEPGDPIAFKHRVIRGVKSLNTAYSRGMRKVDDKIKGTLLNNYVIPMNDKLLGNQKNRLPTYADSCVTCVWYRYNDGLGRCSCKRAGPCGSSLFNWKPKTRSNGL